jgi:hypothetical protein
VRLNFYGNLMRSSDSYMPYPEYQAQAELPLAVVMPNPGN